MTAPGGSKRLSSSRIPFFSSKVNDEKSLDRNSADEDGNAPAKPAKWSFGVLNDKETVEVPGSVLLLANHKNEPLGLRSAPARTSHSSLPASAPPTPRPAPQDDKKKTSDGKIILEPQPENSANDPLNWPTWKRDAALLSLGLYCMIGGGMTPVLAAGFSNVAKAFDVPVARVALTTGLYMMGLGVGSVFFSPTAILFGKRPVYLFGALLFVGTSCWCASAQSFGSLIAGRVLQGVAVSPVECLPSATIAEIYFLHERAFRIGVYTLLLLSGKNLTPLISAAIIQSLSWRWVFWVVAAIVGFAGVMVLLFVPETFWERTPVPRKRAPTRAGMLSRLSSAWSQQAPHRRQDPYHDTSQTQAPGVQRNIQSGTNSIVNVAKGTETSREAHHVKFMEAEDEGSTSAGLNLDEKEREKNTDTVLSEPSPLTPGPPGPPGPQQLDETSQQLSKPASLLLASPDAVSALSTPLPMTARTEPTSAPISRNSSFLHHLPWVHHQTDEERQATEATGNTYSGHWRDREAKSFVQQLRPWHGRLNNDNWLKVAIRPFILFTYPAVLWSAVVYACSIGWLIVISESVTVIYRTQYYHFNALQTGLMYVAPFIGGVLGTAVAGKVSDIIVKAMARRNGGLYEPEFRLVMAIPIAITTIIGLMGFGWSAQAEDAWIVPTVFLGVVSFGCSLGSTTSITFCVDSYRQYAGEALVTLNFTKNILHGLVFSFFVTEWLESDGAKSVFIWIGVIQLILLAFTIPMFIYGKRARMWTIRMNLMEKF